MLVKTKLFYGAIGRKSEYLRKALPTAIILKRAEEFIVVPRAYFIKISVVQFRTI